MTQPTEKLTARQLEALEALLVTGNLRQRRDRAGRWQYVSSMGGALRRMADELAERGYLSTKLDDRQLARDFNEYGGKLTAKALQVLALEGERRDDETLFQTAAELFAKRQETEAAIAAAIAEKEAGEREQYRLEREQRRTRHVAELRKRLEAHGLGEFAAAKSDDELLAFARELEGAEYAD